VTGMENYLAQTGSWVTTIEGVIFVVCVLTFRSGIVGVVLPYVMGRRSRAELPPEEIEIEEPTPAPAPRKLPEPVGETR
jgi:hypothetical protein